MRKLYVCVCGSSTVIDSSSRRSVRVSLLIPSVALIVATTMIPVGFRHPSLSYISYRYSYRDCLNNLVMYLPLGFALAGSSFRRVLLAGLSTSTTAEVLQLGFLDRSSSPFDVASNTCGALAGLALAALVSRIIRSQPRFISVDRRIGMSAIPLAILGVVGLVRHETRSDFSNWSADYDLSIGKEVNGARLWDGVVSRMAIYVDAMNPAQLQNVARGQLKSDEGSSRSSPAIVELGPGSGVLCHYGTRLLSRKQEQMLFETLVKRSRLTLLVWMRTNDIQQGLAHVVTYSREAPRRNFALDQVRAGLTFRLRTPNSGGDGSSPAVDSGPVLSPNRDTFVAATYDGHICRLYVDGVCVGEANLSNKRPRLPGAILRRNPGGLPIREIESSIAEVFLGALFAFGLLSAFAVEPPVQRALAGLAAGLVAGAAIWFLGVSDRNMGLCILLESGAAGAALGASVVGQSTRRPTVAELELCGTGVKK